MNLKDIKRNIREYFRPKGTNTEKEEQVAQALAEDPLVQAIVETPQPDKASTPGRARAGRVLILSIENAGERLKLDYLENPGPGIYDDSNRGLGGTYLPARPITILNHGKPEVGFLVDGDRGVPIKMELQKPVDGENPKESRSILSLTTSARQVHAFLDVHVFAEAYRQRMLGREKLIFICLIILANLIGVILHV